MAQESCAIILPQFIAVCVIALTVSGGVGMQQYMIRNHILNNKTQQTPTKYLYGHKYAVYNKQF